MINRNLLLSLTAICLMTLHAPAAVTSNAERAQKQIAVLQSNAPFFDKARACQQLGEFGNREAIPALAALLGDEHLSAYARSGLEGIPDPSAAEALRKAAEQLKGNLLIGVINSLGVLRDEKSVGLLRRFTEDSRPDIVGASLLALGRIATQESIQTLRVSLGNSSDTARTNAASACLLAAEKQLAYGRVDTAVALYDLVQKANLPLLYRAGATRGAIVSRKSKGIPLLIEQLHSPERIIRHAALSAIREIPSEELARALNGELNRAPVELQIQLLSAMLDCHNSQSLAIIRAKASSDDPEVRKTALMVLGRLGGATEAEVLLRAITANRSAEESLVAMNELERMEAKGIDEQVVKTLPTVADAGSRLKLIRLVESRKISTATPELLKLANDSDTKVCTAALRALKTLSGPADVKALIALIKECKDDTLREAAENALVGACAKSNDPLPAVDAVSLELKQTTDPVMKKSWINVLVSQGNAKSLPVVMGYIRDPNETVAVHAIEQLSRWPDPSPVEDLFAVVQTGATTLPGKRALSIAIQLTTTAVEERQRPDETTIQWFQRANQAAQKTRDRRMIISGLGRLKHIGSLRLLTGYLDNLELLEEAALAVVQIAPALHQADPELLKNTLERIVASVKSPKIRAEAAKISATLPSQAKRLTLFDGKSLSGWEGNTNVWRVRQGAIVGGSLAGNARNEFLATERKYSNFILRLEYKLVGTEGFVNGGVQFHSVRVKQPPNEMSGYQADIGAGYSGCLYDESRRNKFLVRPPEETIKRLEKAGDWNRYEVRCAGPRIQIVLNGEFTLDYTEKEIGISQEGFIALQIHGGCKAEISFRNITLEDLSYAGAAEVDIPGKKTGP